MSDTNQKPKISKPLPRDLDECKSQAEKFQEAAREHETDDDEDRFDERLRKIAKSPPPDKDGKPGKDKPAK